MKYTGQNLAKAVILLAQENPDSPDIVKKFLDFCKQKRLNHLLPIFLKYLKLEAKRQTEIKTLKILSAGELNENLIKKIREISGAKASEPLELALDKKLIAGFVAHYKNKVIDASLNSNLESLKNKLTR